MGKNIIPLSLAVFATLCSPAILYSQSALALLDTESKITQLEPRLNTRTPSVIIRGFDALESDETEKALKIWTDSSIPLIRDNAAITSSITESLIETWVGKCIGYSTIDTLSLTSKTKIVYVESQHEKGALFWRFTVHETPTKSLITSLDINTDPSQIIPISR